MNEIGQSYVLWMQGECGLESFPFHRDIFNKAIPDVREILEVMLGLLHYRYLSGMLAAERSLKYWVSGDSRPGNVTSFLAKRLFHSARRPNFATFNHSASNCKAADSKYPYDWLSDSCLGSQEALSCPLIPRHHCDLREVNKLLVASSSVADCLILALR